MNTARCTPALIALACAVCLGSVSAKGQDCVDYGAHARWAGGLYDYPGSQPDLSGFDNIAASGDIVVAANWSRPELRVIDISDARAPRFRGSASWAGFWMSGGVALVDHRACVAIDSGLVVVDIADPDAPIVVGHLSIPYFFPGLAVDGSTIYLAGHQVEGTANGALVIADLDVSSHPVIRGSLPLAFDCSAVAAGDGIACVAADEELLVVDCADPTEPWLRGVLSLGDYLQDLAFDGVHAWVAAGDSGLVVVDVSNPNQPRRIGRWRGQDWVNRVHLIGDRLLVVGSNGVCLLDAGNPAEPVLVCRTRPAASGRDAAVAGDRLIVAEEGTDSWSTPAGLYGGIQVFTVGPPDMVTPVTQVRGSSAPYYGIAIAQSRAYLAGVYALDIADLSSPRAPVVKARIPQREEHRKLAVDGDRLYVAGVDWNPTEHGWVRVYSLADPDSPLPSGRCELPQPVRAMAVSGDWVYAACGDSGLVVVRADDMRHPVIVARARTDSAACGIAFRGGRLFLAEGSAGLLIYDVTSPGDPRFVGRPADGCRGRAVDAKGDLAFLFFQGWQYGGALHDRGVAVYDVSTPAAPRLLGRADVPDVPLGVTTTGGYLYAAGTAGMMVIDIQDPAAPRYLGSLYPDRQLTDVASADEMVYPVGSGMLVTDRQCGSITAEYLTSFDVRALAGQVDLRWSAASTAIEFRLLAECAAARWSVPILGIFGGSYSACDRDSRLRAGATVTYCLELRDLDGVWVRVATRSITVPATPVRLALTGASPNPFNPQTLIGFTVPRPQQVRLAIHDLAGRRIRTLVDTGLPAGERSLTWSGTDDTGRPVPSGTYLVRLTGADGHDVRKLTLTR